VPVDTLVLAIPVFLVLAALEAALVSRRAGSCYRLGDLVSGLGCGTWHIVLCDGDGCTSSDLALFTYRNRRRPLYPFETA
jgi:hypothetical protein